MTEKELINYLSSYERFVDDDYGGYYESIIQFSDGKLERALTSMSALRIIDEFNKLQQENQRYKKVIDTLTFIKNRAREGATQETINKLAINFVHAYLKY